MKKYTVILSVFMIIFLTSCSQNDSNHITVDKEEMQTYTYQEAEGLRENIKILECEITVPEHGQVDSFYVHDNVVYYSVGFSDYLENHTGLSVVQFEEKYNTQIRSFDMESKEDILLYQYKENICIKVTDIQCNGTYLIWEDYTAENAWNIQKLLLSEGEKPDTIISSEYETGLLWSVTPTITKDSLYWYNQNDESSNPITLYRYDFETQKISSVQNNLALSSPYEHVNIINGICTTFEKKEENVSIIHIYDLKKEEETTLNVSSDVSVPISNGEICVWMTGQDYYDRAILHVYDMSAKTYEQIDVSYAFSYGIMGTYILVNRRDYSQNSYDGLFCYDVKSKTYLSLTAPESIQYGFTFQGLTDTIYAEKFNNKTNLEVISVNFY